MKKLIYIALVGLSLAFTGSAFALSQISFNVVDNKVSGVYRPTVGKGNLTYLKRHESGMYALQGDNLARFEIDSVLYSKSGYEQMVHMLDDTGELVTLDLTMDSATLTFSDGDTVYLTQVRKLTRHDLAKIDPYLPSATPPIQASFPCEKAGTGIEKAICSDPVLAELDVTLAARYKSEMTLSDDKGLSKREQRGWMKERNQCTTVQCLADSYSNRIDQLETVIRYMNKPAEFR